MTGPPASPDRIVELDALRGMAVIGIAWMNVYVFALPLQAYHNPAAYGADGAIDYALWAVSFVLVEDKFRTLFAMLFGLGIALMWDRGSGWRDHLARMAVLLLIGIVHATLLASNDILRVYALAGIVLPFFLRLGWHGLAAAGIVAVGLHLGGGYVWLSGLSADYLALNYGTRPDGIAQALDLGRERFGERIVRRLHSLPASFVPVAAAIPINLAAMLAGVALWRSGVLPSKWSRGRALGLIVLCLLIALPALGLIAFGTGSLRFDPETVARNGLIVSAPFDLLLGCSYAIGLLAVFTRSKDRLLVRLLAAAGRLSLTNYLMTSVVFGAVFSSWGFDLFGRVSRAEAFALSFLATLPILLWSPLWLLRFGQGPMERCWRAATRMLTHKRRGKG
ncbi:DUF418 domain-containing protein [Qipengyuania qiaonensis]|uniref:DUF418 domain-containing protein n=1 Tax=Qipengyuania qiaonensis TaxID=2867240 RepID=A0ABS7J2I1_9SPHN|nr:DUF418 domain-containing protein [Qipengyuania qiaonensis]MBX7481535.1 DUF418 domain-containing protein [Qipengyuania qiaonensis]